MPDLSAAIRQRISWPCDAPELAALASDLAEAVEALLDIHIHIRNGEPPEGYEDFSVVKLGHSTVDFGCASCHYEGHGAVRAYGWCLTIRTIAEKLGIKA